MSGYLDTALDAARTGLRQAVGAVAGRLVRRAPSQALTIGRPKQAVEALFRDTERLSEVLGDVADVVATTAQDRFRWVFRSGPLAGVAWESRVVSTNGQLRFVDAGTDDRIGNEITIDFSEAPRDGGTEVVLRSKTPTPAVLSSVLAYKVLYRARALLQAGEIPTLKHNPSARQSVH